MPNSTKANLTCSQGFKMNTETSDCEDIDEVKATFNSNSNQSTLSQGSGGNQVQLSLSWTNNVQKSGKADQRLDDPPPPQKNLKCKQF